MENVYVHPVFLYHFALMRGDLFVTGDPLSKEFSFFAGE